MIAEHNIEMVRGDTFAFTITVDGDIGTISVVTMTARRQATDEILFTLTNGSGVTAITNGWEVRIPPSATLAATPGLYKYDVELVMSGGDVYTPLHGSLRIHEDQTREVS